MPMSLPHVPLSAEVRHNLFMAFKEALNNAVKHGHPRNIVIALALEPRRLKLSVEDDGCGFSLDTPQPARTVWKICGNDCLRGRALRRSQARPAWALN